MNRPEEGAAVLELRTLGKVDLRPAGEDRDVSPALLQSKRLALLAYLAVARPRGLHSRDTLMGLFWPELDSSRARNSLRQALFFLRHTLGVRVQTGRGREEVGLPEGALWCDAVAFEEALEARDLARAIDLYAGEFLEGFHVADSSEDFYWWVDRERARLRTAMLSALRSVADREEAAGRPHAATTLLRRAIGIDPDDERSVRRLIGLLGSHGDRAGALQAYETFRERCRQEYGAEPSPETVALVRDLRRGEPAAARAPAAVSARLPLPMTTFVGRDREIREALKLLHRSDVRLLTLTGPGGCGKTRLALEIASRYGGDEAAAVHFVPLASIRSPGLVMSAIARAVGVPRGGSALDALGRHFGSREILLVLDNLEHLTDVAGDVVELLQSAAGVKILTTSRAPLRVSAERTLVLPPLSLPDPRGPRTPEAVGGAEAAALFVERARAADASFRLDDANAGAVAEVCRRLDGLPLAIELAAAQTRWFTPETLLDRLSSPLAALRDGPRDLPDRHRGLEATIRWSYELLSPEERALFRRVALFVGGAPLDALATMWEKGGGERDEAVDLVAALIEKSLLLRGQDADGRTRVGMLETIREYALAALDAFGETETWYRWQAEYWLAWTEAGEGFYCTIEEASWQDRLDREHDNLRGALGWALAAGEVETALRMATSLWYYWWQRGLFSEGRRWLEQCLAAAGPELPERLRARALFGAGSLAVGQGEHARAVELMEKSLAFYRRANDLQGTAVLLQNLGYAHRELGDRVRARELFEEALVLRRTLNDSRGTAAALEGLGELALQDGDLPAARRWLEESLALGQQTGHRERTAHVLLVLGDLARIEGDDERAAVLYERGLERYRTLKQALGIGQALSSLADVALRRGSVDRARELYAEALLLYRDTGYARRIASSLIGFAAIAVAQDRAERAARLCGGIDALIESKSVVLEREENDVYEATMMSSRRRLGGDDFAEQWAAGRRMSADETITLALQLVPPGPSAPLLRRAAGR